MGSKGFLVFNVMCKCVGVVFISEVSVIGVVCRCCIICVIF